MLKRNFFHWKCFWENHFIETNLTWFLRQNIIFFSCSEGDDIRKSSCTFLSVNKHLHFIWRILYIFEIMQAKESHFMVFCWNLQLNLVSTKLNCFKTFSKLIAAAVGFVGLASADFIVFVGIAAVAVTTSPRGPINRNFYCFAQKQN